MNSPEPTLAGAAVQREINRVVKQEMKSQISSIENLSRRVLTGETSIEINFQRLGSSSEEITRKAAFAAFIRCCKMDRGKLAASIAREYNIDRGEVLEALGDMIVDILSSWRGKKKYHNYVSNFELTDEEISAIVIPRFKSKVENSDGPISQRVLIAFENSHICSQRIREEIESILAENPDKLIRTILDEGESSPNLRHNLLPLLEQTARIDLVNAVENELLVEFISLISNGEYRSFEEKCRWAERSVGIKWSDIDSAQREEAAIKGIKRIISNFLDETANPECSYKQRSLKISSITGRIVSFMRHSGLEFNFTEFLPQMSDDGINDWSIIASCQLMHSLGIEAGYLGAEPARILIAAAEKFEETELASTDEKEAFTDLVASITASTEEVTVRERIGSMLALSKTEDIGLVRKVLASLQFPLLN